MPCDETTGPEYEQTAVNATYLNFRNAFGAVPHSIFVSKIGYYGRDGWMKWMDEKLAQRVVVNGFPPPCLVWRLITSQV